jgi:opacity protein-like surface antigen
MGMNRLILLAVLAVFVLACFASASDVGFKAANLRLGYVSPEGDIESTIGFGGGVDLGTIGKINSETENIGLEAVIFYWSKSYGLGDWDWKYSDLAIKVNAKYYFQAQNVKPYAGAGLGLHLYSWKWEHPSHPGFSSANADGSDTKIGIQLLGGVEYPVSEKVGIVGELEFGFDDPNQLIISAGASMKLGQ